MAFSLNVNHGFRSLRYELTQLTKAAIVRRDDVSNQLSRESISKSGLKLIEGFDYFAPVKPRVSSGNLHGEERVALSVASLLRCYQQAHESLLIPSGLCASESSSCSNHSQAAIDAAKTISTALPSMTSLHRIIPTNRSNR